MNFFLDTSIYSEFQIYLIYLQVKGGSLVHLEEGLVQEHYNREYKKTELNIQNNIRVKELVRISSRSFVYIIFLDNKLRLLLNTILYGVYLIEICDQQTPTSSLNTRDNSKFIISINRGHPLTNSYIDYLNPYSLQQDFTITIKEGKVTFYEI